MYTNRNYNSLSLKRNILWSFIGNVVYAGCQWGILSMLAKITNPQTVGQFALGIAISAPIFAFSNLQIREVQATDTQGEHYFATYFGFRILSSMFALILVICIALLSSYRSETIIVIVIVGVAKGVESLGDIGYGLMQKYEQMHKIARSMMIKGTLSLVSFTLIIALFHSIVAGCIALVISWGILLIIYDFKIVYGLLKEQRDVGGFGPVFKCHDFKRLFWLASPLGIVILLNTLNLNIPRYIIADIYGEAILGYYSAIAYTLIAGSTAVNAIGQSAMPRLAKYYLHNTVAYKLLMLKIFGLAVFIGVLGIVTSLLFGRYILTFLYTASYANYTDLLFWTMVGALALYCSVMVGCGISAARAYKSQLLISIIVTTVIIIGSYFLIPNMGVVGGAIALSIGFIVKFIGQSIQVILLINKTYL